MCVHICANTHVLALAVMCISRSENSWQESVLSFHVVAPKDQTHSITLLSGSFTC